MNHLQDNGVIAASQSPKLLGEGANPSCPAIHPAGVNVARLALNQGGQGSSPWRGTIWACALGSGPPLQGVLAGAIPDRSTISQTPSVNGQHSGLLSRRVRVKIPGGLPC